MIIDHPTWEIMGKSIDCQSYLRSPLWRLDISKSHPSTDPVVWGDTWSHRLASESQWRFSEISWGIMIFRYFQKYLQVIKNTCFVMHKVLFNRPRKMFLLPSYFWSVTQMSSSGAERIWEMARFQYLQFTYATPIRAEREDIWNICMTTRMSHINKS